jgi:hypothetical protein
VKIDSDMVKEDLGLSKDSKLILTEMQEKTFAGASSRAKIVSMARDAFGAKYQERYGVEIDPPKVGDFVYFTAYKPSKLDQDGEYFKIKDDSVDLIVRSK